MKIDHIGYVTKDIKKKSRYFTNTLGYKVLTSKIIEPAHDVSVQFFSMGNNSYPLLELIEPLNKRSKILNFLKKYGEGIHHIAYEVININKKIEYFRKKNFIVLSEIVPGAGHNNTPTVWLYSYDGDLIELIQKQKNKKSFTRLTKKFLKIKY